MPDAAGKRSQDQIAGSVAALQVGDWVTAGGAGTLVDLGYLGKVEVEYSDTHKQFKPSNSFGPTRDYKTARVRKITAQIAQSSLRTLATTLGDVRTAVLAAAGSATYPDEDPTSTEKYFQVALVETGLDMLPSFTEGATDKYIKRTRTWWRCSMKPNHKLDVSLDGEQYYGIELVPCRDDSVTSSTSIGKYGKTVDSTT
jgi:hypothetical protein